MSLPRELALDEKQIDEIMQTQWVLRVATLGPKGRINLTPMWFGWAGGKVYIVARGQKVVNLRRDPTCSIIVDRNERFPELQAVLIQGRGQVLEDRTAEDAEPDLPEARIQMGRKYQGGHGGPSVAGAEPNAFTASGRNRRWIVVHTERAISWDNFKLPRRETRGGSAR